MFQPSLFSFLDIDGPTLSKPNNIVMNETASLSVTCSAKSKPNANYVWTTKSGKFVSNGANLSFASLNRSDSNEYECKASNAAGSKTSSKLTINVQCKSDLLDLIHFFN